MQYNICGGNMKKEVDYKNDLKKVNVLLYVIIVFLFIFFLVFLFNLNSKDTKNKDYDVSMMREVNVTKTLDLFNTQDTYVLYIGRKSCDICHDLLPTLQEAQKENNYITQYLDISKVDRSSDDWKKLVELFDVKTDQTLTANGSGESVNETFGYFLDEKGFTPCVIIISNGKMKAGFFGDKEYSVFEDWLQSNMN